MTTKKPKKDPLYTGIIGRRDTRRGRLYDIVTGEAYPSVTTVLHVLNKPALIPWAAKEERKLLEVVFRKKWEELREVLGENMNSVSGEEFVSQVFADLGSAKAHQRLLRTAADIGTQVHKKIEWDIKRMLLEQQNPSSEEEHQKRQTSLRDLLEPVLEHPKAVESYSKYLAWKEVVNMRPLSTEMPIVSHVHKYAGTEDIRIEVRPPASDPIWEMVRGKHPNGYARTWQEETTLILTGDFKTGKAVYGEMFLQNGAYRLAEREMGVDPDSDAGIIIRLPKEADDPNFDVVAVPPLEETIPAFLALRAAFNWHKKDEERYERLKEEKKKFMEEEANAA